MAATTSPVLTPMRIVKRTRSSVSRWSFSAVKASRISNAARTARRASSSWTSGMPKTATTASPTTSSTVPPCRSSTARISWKQRSSGSRLDSGSRGSPARVDPRTSAMSVVTVRRVSRGRGTGGIGRVACSDTRSQPARVPERLQGPAPYRDPERRAAAIPVPVPDPPPVRGRGPRAPGGTPRGPRPAAPSGRAPASGERGRPRATAFRQRAVEGRARAPDDDHRRARHRSAVRGPAARSSSSRARSARAALVVARSPSAGPRHRASPTARASAAACGSPTANARDASARRASKRPRSMTLPSARSR